MLAAQAARGGQQGRHVVPVHPPVAEPAERPTELPVPDPVQPPRRALPEGREGGPRGAEDGLHPAEGEPGAEEAGDLAVVPPLVLPHDLQGIGVDVLEAEALDEGVEAQVQGGAGGGGGAARQGGPPQSILRWSFPFA